ncbi:hypothetical protein A3F62_04990 [Candidatus Woesebacteria bacterium RIFCSPHIGHO2_12_FULL_44_11]|uniref:Uncharacterized protein n=1 Tax=Candidatus Woesebacteria bacterium RIFCSPLOWO2_01_FULL_44_14 TaxID=1802525 RepID=A0A1F8BZI7_9BACT|nr:MAG: hypothetical protein A3F62_04990 [Candidatus Woesebacteria bacterium RIFCSPHIGHO2_12_FULL_44_11]OGM68775.1 MAG: hypothetical protein A2975_02885 [Candidatus Woesebacteria bacterium RIFCSPLOWO2_01_FULL_44_14]
MKLPIDAISKIPVFSMPDSPLSASTQKHLPLVDIVDNIALYRDGGAALILESTSLNFGLLSEKEQQAVIIAYAALLNSFSFSVQILVRSQRKDITSYLAYLNEARQKLQETKSPKLQILMDSYIKFITETIKKKNVLGKRFYIIIPFSSYELGVAKSALAITRRSDTLPFPKSYVVKKAKTVLLPRRDHLMRQAGRLGLRLRQLAENQMVELMYDVYNPIKQSVKQKLEQNG